MSRKTHNGWEQINIADLQRIVSEASDDKDFVKQLRELKTLEELKKIAPK